MTSEERELAVVEALNVMQAHANKTRDKSLNPVTAWISTLSGIVAAQSVEIEELKDAVRKLTPRKARG